MKQSKFTPLFQRITAVYIECMLTLYLLWPGFGGYAQLTAAKWRLFLLVSLGYLAVSVLLALELAVIGRLRLPRPVKLRKTFSIQDRLLLGFWVCSALSTLWAVDRTTAFWGSTPLQRPGHHHPLLPVRPADLPPGAGPGPGCWHCWAGHCASTVSWPSSSLPDTTPWGCIPRV